MAWVNIRRCEEDGRKCDVRGDEQGGMVLSLKSGDGEKGSRAKQPMCEVLIGGRKLELMADSGSPWTIVVQDYFERIFEGIWSTTDLNEPDILAESFDGTTIDLVGFVETEIVFKERRANIKLYVAAKDVNVLGWRDQGEGVIPKKSLVDAIVNAPAPDNREKLLSFTGLCYSKFIENFAAKMEPLRELTRKGVQCIWTERQS
ncbi:hypothetical protein NDU88_003219 [Pleurodeles waltl]|uniref:Uncharacterized protein n=1 Tax=Pleurodeles waltl TaxID=8319 RepID=A0AAV7M871_PLEWA|nr:hypothetical protein NDU88_003219 [Pleurodeles waltl]